MIYPLVLFFILYAAHGFNPERLPFCAAVTGFTMLILLVLSNLPYWMAGNW